MTIVVAPLTEAQLPAADHIMRLAFGTFLGLPNPLSFGGDCDYARTRWQIEPGGAFAALDDGELVGSNFAARWGSFGFFGPLSVRPDLWDRGVARQLLDVTMRRFDDWGVTHTGLFTFAQSPKHIGLYMSYGFYPRFLTPVMAKPVAAAAMLQPAACASGLGGAERAAAFAECRALSNTVYAGLDLGDEQRAAQAHGLGDTLLLRDGADLDGFAVCHVGPGTEAGSGVCYVKFGCVAPGVGAAERFTRLLALCARFAAGRGAVQLVAGTNVAREPAYRAMLAAGFRTFIQGVAMQRLNTAAFCDADAWVIDDWR